VIAGISTAASVLMLCVAMWLESSTSKLNEEHSASAKLVAEFVGTFMLIFSVGCNVLVGDPTWGVVSIACTLMVMIYALGGISGGNFNPAVSVTLGLAGKMPWSRVCAYTLTQVAAGVIAGNAYGLMLGQTFNLDPVEGFDYLHAGLAELLYTFMLTFCVLNTACSKKHAGKEQFYGLAIGFVVVAGGFGAGAISGGCFNPAVALGIDTSSARLGFGTSLVYLLFQLMGSALAAALYRICRPDDYDESVTEYPLGSTLTAEFLGTYMLVLTVGLNVLAPNGTAVPGSRAAVFSIAASLMCMIFALGSCSGAHFNPAVTYAVFRRGGPVTAARSLLYVAVQIIAGIAAAGTFIYMSNGKTVPLQPKGGFENAAHIGEFIFTFLLAFVVLCVATVEKPLSNYFGLAIGSCVTAGGLAIGSLSGGCLNPAVSAGLGVTSGQIGTVLSYSAVQLVAGELAAGVFKLTHSAELAAPKNVK
jgi:aquaporin Z